MTSSRLEAFSDGVIAVIITIMVLELKVPHDQTLEGLRSLLPIFLGYALSFLLVAIYWVNHHHLLHLVKNVEPKTMWFNLLLLFWLSLTPFATEYMGASHASSLSVAFYGTVQSLCAISYRLLAFHVSSQRLRDNLMSAVYQRNARKNGIATLCSLLSVPLAFLNVALSLGLLVLPALMYFVPEREVENIVKAER